MTLVLNHHSSTDSLTILSYDPIMHTVVVKTTAVFEDQGRMLPEYQEISLVQFLHQVGIPFAHAREVTRGEAQSPEVALT